MAIIKEEFKGKLDEIYNHPIVQEYLTGEIQGNIVGGYLGHENRTDETDIMLEETLNDEYLELKVVATWVCSKSGRYFMDECNDIEYFKENILDTLIDYQDIDYYE